MTATETSFPSAKFTTEMELGSSTPRSWACEMSSAKSILGSNGVLREDRLVVIVSCTRKSAWASTDDVQTIQKPIGAIAKILPADMVTFQRFECEIAPTNHTLSEYVRLNSPYGVSMSEKMTANRLKALCFVPDDKAISYQPMYAAVIV